MLGGTIRIFVIFLILAPIYSWADCSYEKSINIAFKNDDATDILTSRVVAGEDCSKGFEHITIKTKNGYWLYEYYSPLAKYFRRPVTKDDVIRVVENNLSERYFSKSSQLPKWQEPDKYYDAHSGEISVPKEKYIHYKTKEWLTYSHQVGYEGFKTIVYDRDKNITREVTGGSP